MLAKREAAAEEDEFAEDGGKTSGNQEDEAFK